MQSVGFKTQANKTARGHSTRKSELYTNRYGGSERQSIARTSKDMGPGLFKLASNKSDARKTIRAQNFGLYYEEFEGHKEVEQKDRLNKKLARLAGEFKPAFNNDKTQGVARTTDDAYLATAHTFDTFMGEREDLPRLSILSNYEQIMKIMHANYVKSKELDVKYKNRSKNDVSTDEDFAVYVEE